MFTSNCFLKNSKERTTRREDRDNLLAGKWKRLR